ncbi:MAG: histidinol-phosphate transaminase [Cyclobacteriaceae bacterium]|jgi:histidinol-phosphate aminotransferase|nr:histidinol-phosphate transaminase [Cyclobacteriaceae bacterium]
MDISKLVRENIKALAPYSSARDEFSSTADVYLDANENPFENSVNRYPDPYQKKVKTKLARIKSISSKNILLGNGSDEVLDLIYRAFCEPLVDNIITSPPTYGMYKVLAGINNIENRLAPLNSDFSLNFDDIKSMVDENSKLIFICSPNNPSGNSLDDNVIERLLKETECIVCIDEAYIDFTDKKSWLARLDEFPNLIVCQTLSKAWGMAGIRLGICYASQYIIGILNKIKPPYNINQLTQNKALEVLGNEELFSQNLNVILSEKKLLEKAMLEFPFVKRIFPSDANFFLAEFDDPKYVFGALMAKEIIVRDRSKELHCDGCLRITIGTPVENKKLIEVLKKL